MQNIDEYWICILLLMSLAYAYTLTHTWVYTVHGYHTHDTVRWWHGLTKAPESAQRDSLSRVFRPSNSQIPIPQNARSLDFQLHEYLNHLNPEGDSHSHAECAAAFHIIAQGAAPHRKSYQNGAGLFAHSSSTSGAGGPCSRLRSSLVIPGILTWVSVFS